MPDVHQSSAFPVLPSEAQIMPWPGRNLWHALRRRLVAALALFAYLLTALGVPLPAAAPVKDRSQPFPCQDHACGCRTADECWRRCCCYSPEERRAWARSHGITPPDADLSASGGWHSPRQRDRSCCRSCCSHEATEPCREETTTLVGLSALQCQGLTTLWQSIGAVVLPRPCTWTEQLPLVAWIVSPHSVRLIHFIAPPDPPPRVAHV